MKRLEDKKRRVEFVSYSGEYPNLCSGILILKVDDKEVIFPKYSIRSGGSTDYKARCKIQRGDWSLDFPDDFPDELMEEATRVVNENVELGCCGGCL